MVNTSLNIFDVGVLVIIGLSALLSFYRGFLREMLSLCSWIGASLFALYAFPHVSEMIEPQVKNSAIASGLAALGVFMVGLIGMTIFSGMILKYAKPGQEVGFLDNIIGLTFGIARGVLLVSICYFVLTLVMVEKDYPDWVKDAMTRPYVADASRFVAKLAPKYLNTIVQDMDKKALDTPLPPRAPGATPAQGNTSSDIRSFHEEPPSMEDLEKRMREMDAKKREEKRLQNVR